LLSFKKVIADFGIERMIVSIIGLFIEMRIDPFIDFQKQLKKIHEILYRSVEVEVFEYVVSVRRHKKTVGCAYRVFMTCL
jgi:hypothetical protein